MTWKCAQTGSRCYDLPDDCSLVCACAAVEHGKITIGEVRRLEELHMLRRARAADEGRKAVALALGIKGLEAMEAAQ